MFSKRPFWKLCYFVVIVSKDCFRHLGKDFFDKKLKPSEQAIFSPALADEFNAVSDLAEDRLNSICWQRNPGFVLKAVVQEGVHIAG